MKVILLEDVKNVGKKGEVVEVNDNFARNVLLRSKKGVEATGKNMNDLKLRKANDEKVAAENLAAAQELAKKVGQSEVTLKVKVGEGGQLTLPEYAREVFGIRDGDRLMVMGDTAKGGIALAKISLGNLFKKQ